MFERVPLSALLRVFSAFRPGLGFWRIALYVVGPIDILRAHVSGDSDANTPSRRVPTDGLTLHQAFDSSDLVLSKSDWVRRKLLFNSAATADARSWLR